MRSLEQQARIALLRQLDLVFNKVSLPWPRAKEGVAIPVMDGTLTTYGEAVVLIPGRSTTAEKIALHVQLQMPGVDDDIMRRIMSEALGRIATAAGVTYTKSMHSSGRMFDLYQDKNLQLSPSTDLAPCDHLDLGREPDLDAIRTVIRAMLAELQPNPAGVTPGGLGIAGGGPENATGIK